ncbi:MAG: Holliday junction branch migration protein RuvA [Raoultibacter sp.]
MIAFIKGTLIAKDTSSIVIETQGVGYTIGMSSTGLSKLPEAGAQLLVYTYLQVREDGFSLFGFLTMEEKELFLKLISISGIGPKVALSALSLYQPAELIKHITAQDITAVSRIPGVGKKSASRIVLELKGYLDQDLLESEQAPALETSAMQATQEALLSMGFTTAEVELALKGSSEEESESALLQYALKRLGT